MSGVRYERGGKAAVPLSHSNSSVLESLVEHTEETPKRERNTREKEEEREKERD